MKIITLLAMASMFEEGLDKCFNISSFLDEKVNKERKSMGQSGKSKSNKNPYGMRKKSEGKELAPKSLRRKGKVWLSDCSDKDLEKAGIV